MTTGRKDISGPTRPPIGLPRAIGALVATASPATAEPLTVSIHEVEHHLLGDRGTHDEIENMAGFLKSMEWKKAGKTIVMTLRIVLRVLRKFASATQSLIGHLTGTKRYAKRVAAASDRMESALESLTSAIKERDQRIDLLEKENQRLAQELRNWGR